MFLHDINAHGVENKEALMGARRSVALMRDLPPLVSATKPGDGGDPKFQGYSDVDTFIVTVWSMVAKVLLKELRRVCQLNDAQGESYALYK